MDGPSLVAVNQTGIPYSPNAGMSRVGWQHYQSNRNPWLVLSSVHRKPKQVTDTGRINITLLLSIRYLKKNALLYLINKFMKSISLSGLTSTVENNSLINEILNLVKCGCYGWCSSCVVSSLSLGYSLSCTECTSSSDSCTGPRVTCPSGSVCGAKYREIWARGKIFSKKMLCVFYLGVSQATVYIRGLPIAPVFSFVEKNAVFIFFLFKCCWLSPTFYCLHMCCLPFFRGGFLMVTTAVCDCALSICTTTCSLH